MARIRTIKPEFWTDERVIELDFWERLLFIALWNFADDQGYIAHSPKRIKMQCFPSDDVDISRGLARLLESSFLEAFDVADGSGDVVLRIRTWDKQQRISNPAKPKYVTSKLRKRRNLDDLVGSDRIAGSEILASPLEPSVLLGNGSSEGKGEEEGASLRVVLIRPDPSAGDLPHGQAQLMADAVLEAWNRIAQPPMRQALLPSPSQGRVVTAVRLQPSWDVWERAFVAVSDSDYLTGRVPGRDGRTFEMTLWFLLDHLGEVLDGKYANASSGRQAVSVSNGHRPDRVAVPGIADTAAMLDRMEREAGRA